MPVGETAAVALAASASVAAALWEERTGRPQDIRVEVARAAASLVSYRLLRRGDATAYPPRGDGPNRVTPPLVSFYPCADGRWIHVHGAFPPHVEITQKVLGCTSDRASRAEAVSRWNAFDLEDALADAGTCGAAVRTTDEWRLHLQADALGALATVQVDKIGDSDPEPVGDGVRPLGGVRVVELARFLAGPSCGLVLAAHGADVLLVNAPGLPNIEAMVIDTSHGKLSTHLDLNRAEDAARLRELVAGADVFTQGYRLGTLERRGLGPSELAALRPGIIAVSINCYGDAGAWRTRPGWEQLAQSVTGLAAAQGSFDRPYLIPAAACDYTTGYLAALGTAAALWRRAREGGSYHVRASLCQTGMWIQSQGARCDPESAPGVGDGGPWMTSTDTPYGRLTHLTPPVDMTDSPMRWARPASPPGTHAADWPAR